MPWGLHVKWGLSPALLKENVLLSTCSHRVMCTGAGSDILADVSSNTHFITLRQKGFRCQRQRTAAMGRSRRRSRARRHLRAGFPTPVLCSHPPPAAPAQAKQTSEPWTSCSPLWEQPPTWLMPGAGLGHPQRCSGHIHSHFRGESSLKSFRTFL